MARVLGVAERRQLAESERFWLKVGPVTLTGCQEWQAARGHKGHGRFWMEGRNHPAHRIAWMLAGRTIPEGFSVLHHCDNPPCIEVHHLYVGTKADNNHDRDAKGRACRGDDHWTRLNPQKALATAARGDRQGQRTHPERYRHRETWRTSKLSFEKAEEIRILHAADPRVSQRVLAARFGVAQTQISAVLRGKSWRPEWHAS